MSDSSSNKTSSRSSGRAAGVVNYSREDINSLLDLVDSIRPVGKNGWNNLTAKYNKLVNQNRQPDCLKRKFLSLTTASKNSNSKQELLMNDVSKRARRLQKEIYSSSDLSLDMHNDNNMSILPFDTTGSNTDTEDSMNNNILSNNDQISNQKDNICSISDNKTNVYNILLNDINIDTKQSNHLGLDNRNNNTNNNEYLSYHYGSNSSNSIDNIYSILSSHSESLHNLTNILSNFITQSHQQHTELINTLTNQNHLIQSQLSHHLDMQSKQFNSISVVMTSILQTISPNSRSNNNQNMIYQQPQVYNQNSGQSKQLIDSNSCYDNSHIYNGISLPTQSNNSSNIFATNDDIHTSRNENREDNIGINTTKKH